ncbi:exo-rhamnogalacturonan lyase family protein [Nonomuraea angiospora]|uniref:exo-rhamnogalacturonan lyase family protein n=1 Tax=Nonomuraea angiospora TaxID=46172 RepID=UPI0038D4CC67
MGSVIFTYPLYLETQDIVRDVTGNAPDRSCGAQELESAGRVALGLPHGGERLLAPAVAVCKRSGQDHRDPDSAAAFLTVSLRARSTSRPQREVTGADWGNLNLKQAYSRATAYAARQLSDVTLAERAWQDLRTGRAHDPAYRLPGHRHVFQEDGAPIPNTSISCARVR